MYSSGRFNDIDVRSPSLVSPIGNNLDNPRYKTGLEGSDCFGSPLGYSGLIAYLCASSGFLELCLRKLRILSSKYFIENKFPLVPSAGSV